ncbi:MAG: hypothetical protein ACKVT0_20650 [Planctomycetaceae bacterium]
MIVHPQHQPTSIPFCGRVSRVLILAGWVQAVMIPVVFAADEQFRPADTRPQHDDAKLAALGIKRYESRRLRLYTDVDEEFARQIPPIVDQAYEAWEEYFGKLPPAPDGADFQMTGYALRDQQLFREGKLIPEGLPPFINGRHRLQEFWVNVTEQNYYLKHLIVHEATHCFMTILPDSNSPPWYLEGMAELFGTHHQGVEGKCRFRILPGTENIGDFEHWERINILKRDIELRGMKSLEQVLGLSHNEFGNNASYAWSWSVCQFLDAHPRYRDRFRELGQHRGAVDFPETWERLFGSEIDTLKTEWNWFAHAVCPGYDWKRAGIEFQRGDDFDPQVPAVARVAADRGWQSSKIRLQVGEKYRITATGRSTLADDPRPWISEPQGISIRYNQGQPVGRLIGIIEEESPVAPQPSDEAKPAKETTDSRFPLLVIGKRTEFTSTVTGTLYLRVNDAFSSLDNNSGEYTVTVESPAKLP